MLLTELMLENDAVRLEPLEKEHYDALSPIALEHPDLLRYSPSAFGPGEKLRKYIETAIDAREVQRRLPFAIYNKSSDTYVGSTSFGDIALEHQRLSIGWTWLDKSVQGTGLNKQCKFLMLQYAFEVLDMQRVEFKIDMRNMQSRRAVEKIGGQFEGCLRSHLIMQDGYRRDTASYSILKVEWEELKQTVFKDLL